MLQPRAAFDPAFVACFLPYLVPWFSTLFLHGPTFFFAVFSLAICSEFCGTELGSEYCQSGNVRNFFVEEAGSLGPAVAR